jgi:hypothetical protein
MFIEQGLGDYGAAVQELEVLACFRGGRIANASLKGMYEEYHERLLPSLPIIRYTRGKARLNLTYESRLVDASFLEKHGSLSAEMFSHVLDELANQLHLCDERLRRIKTIDLELFHADVSAIIATAPSTDEELKSLQERLNREWKARVDAMDPWERLDIDWREYHPDARHLLTDVFFWSVIDDYAPHGNDTGADLFVDFRT